MSWLDTLTSTPLLVAGILGMSVAVIINRRDPAVLTVTDTTLSDRFLYRTQLHK
jgi:hypothetical protein